MKLFKTKLEREKERIAKMEEERNVEGLIEALRSEYPEVVSAAANALGVIGDKRAVVPLIDTLLNPANPIDVHISCALALGYLRDRRAVKALLEAIDEVRLTLYPPAERFYIPGLLSAVALSLGRIGDPSALETITSLLTHKSAAVRKYAAKGLAELGDERALDDLIEALELEEEEEVQEAIKEAIERIGEKDAKEGAKETQAPEISEVPEIQGDEDTIMKRKGFVAIVEVLEGVKTRVYWHPEMKCEVAIAKVGGKYFVKGMKKYYVKGISEAGKETWDRNLGQLMDTLRISFPEFHLYMAGIMRVTPNMVPEDGALKYFEESFESHKKEAKQLERKLEWVKEELREKEIALNACSSLTTDGVIKLRQECAFLKEKQKSLEELYEWAKDSMERDEKEYYKSLLRHNALVREYMEKGAATCFVIAYSTVLRSGKKEELEILVSHTIDDINTAHKYGSFTQTLKDLHIYYEEVTTPWVTHVAEFVGIFSPAHLEADEKILKDLLPFFVLTGVEDIVVDGEVLERGKKTPGRTFQAFLRRVRAIGEDAQAIPELPKTGGWIGNLVLNNKVTDIPVFFPLEKLNHGYISGTTGSGKTFLARVLVENAIAEGVNVVVLDRTRQWTGLIKPAKSEESSARFKALGLKEPFFTGFPAKVLIVQDVKEFMENFTRNVESMMQGCLVISVKGLSDKEACEVAKLVLEASYHLADKETERLERLVVIEEAHAFLPGHVDPSAKEEAQEVRRLIDRISREKRKYGLNLLLITQSISDFKDDARIVREMCNTKFFMRATDKSELEYVTSYISQDAAETVKWLKDGEVLLKNPNFEPIRVCVRPPFSHVGELSEEELAAKEGFERAREEFLARMRRALKECESLSEKEEEFLLLAKKLYAEKKEPIAIIELAESLGLEGGTRQRIVEELEKKGLIKVVELPSERRGRPRKGIIPLV